MDDNTPVSRELSMLIPVLADTMKFATQALAESGALASVLIAKGVLTKSELDAAMTPIADLKRKLMDKLDEESKKQS
jgi:hypothetical protein